MLVTRLSAPLRMQLEYLQQPIVHAGTGTLVGVELLSRIEGHPPGAVLGDNVNAWLALDIGALAHIRDGGITSQAGKPQIFVNLSRYIAHQDWATTAFLHACRQSLERSWVEIVVEVDEAVNLPDRQVVALAKRVRMLGMRCAMDDHRGSPSCYRRSRLDCWDIIKVCTQNRAIEAACIDIRQLAATGVPVVAEAIETARAHRLAAEAGAHCIQGWHTGFPVPVWSGIRHLLRVEDPVASTTALAGAPCHAG